MIVFVCIWSLWSRQESLRGQTQSIPGRIEAEDFSGYFDIDSINLGGAYRPNDGVDIQVTADVGGGYNVGWTDAHERMRYSINILTPGYYTIEARVASESNPNEFSMYLDSAELVRMAYHSTGGWQNWATLRQTGVYLNLGFTSIEVTWDVTAGNLNWFNFILESSSTPKDLASPGAQVVGSSDHFPGAESPVFAIDNDPTTKYLNGDGAGSGLTIPLGAARIVTGMTLTSANDEPRRDPEHFQLYGGSQVGGPFQLIAAGDVPVFPSRFFRRTLTFPNAQAYLAYKLVFDRLRGPNPDAMQIAEVELLGHADGDPSVLEVQGDLAFGAVTVASSTTRVLSIANRSLDPLESARGFNLIYPQGFSGPGFLSIPRGESRTLEVRFSPEVASEYDGLLVLETPNQARPMHGNFVALTGTGVATPFQPPVRNIPGKVEAEDFDVGGEGVGYHDQEPANQGGQYRTLEGVDIEASIDEGGRYDVGWSNRGEWLKYTVTVTEGANYTVEARVASAANGGKLRVELDDNPWTRFEFLGTGNWQTWVTVSKKGLALPSGTHVLKVFWEDTEGGANLNWLNFIREPAGGIQDFTRPGDPITAFPTGYSPPGKGVEMAIDDNPTTKYLNEFGDKSELTIHKDVPYRLTGIALTSANDAPERDPSGVLILGSGSAEGPFEPITSFRLIKFSQRFQRKEFSSIVDERYFQHFRLIFDGFDSVTPFQIAEVELLGFPGSTRSIALSGDLGFGNVAVGASATRTMTIANTGTATLNVSGISYPPGFSGSWAGSIAPNGSQLVSVTFTPTGAVSYGGTVNVSSDATGGTATLVISGMGTSAPTRTIALSGDLGFGNVTVGASATRTMTIANTGTAALNVSGISYPPGFSGSWAGSIAPNGSQLVSVTFTPTGAVSYGGNVNVSSDATGGTATLVISGMGMAGAIELVDVTQPGDSISSQGGFSPADEAVANAIDDNPGTKYFNGSRMDSALVVLPRFGASVVTGISLTSANDVPSRDPASFVLSGSNDGGLTWTEIARENVPAFSGRQSRQRLTFANTAAYTAYRLYFPTFQGDVDANMQIAEVELLRAVAVAPQKPSITSFSPSQTVTEGDSISLIVEATGTAPLSYEWKVGTITLPTAGSVLPLAEVTPAMAGAYSVTVHNAVGSTTSPVAVLTVQPRPEVGTAGRALRFDGVDDVVVIGGAPALANRSFTIELWVRSTRTDAHQYFLLQGDGNAGRGLHLGYRSNNHFAFGFWSDDLETAGVYTDSNWHHWACTYEAISRTRAVYRDGELVAQDIAAGPFLGSGPLEVGRLLPINSHFEGELDEIRIWSTARTAESIKTLYNRLIVGNEPGLLGHWRLDEGSGTTAVDGVQGGAGGGVLQNGVQWVTSTAPINAVVAPTRTIALRGDLGFGTVTVGSSATRTMTIVNTGTVALNVSGISYPTGFAGDWTGSIAPNGSQLVSVTFTPTGAVSYGGNVNVSSDATGGTATLVISGMGRLGPRFGDLTRPGDGIVAIPLNQSPPGEDVTKAIDNNSKTKYFTFQKLNSGLIVTPASGPSTLTALTLTSANDVPARDPASVQLSGSNDGGATFTTIVVMEIPPFPARFATQTLVFANDKSYTTYRLLFPTVRGGAGEGGMQFAELELIEKIQPPKQPSTLAWNEPPSITYGSPLGTVHFAVQANVPGDFAYEPPLGTILHAGVRTLTVVFTPRDLELHLPATASKTVVVNQAVLRVRAADSSMIRGGLLPAFVPVYSGFVNREGPADLDRPVRFSTDATSASPPGTYAVTPFGATDANYSFDYQPGVLTISAAPNSPPTLTAVTPLSGGVQDQPVIISYATLAAAANEADADGDTLAFRIGDVLGGVLTKGGVPVIPGSTVLPANEDLLWAPPPGVTGLRDAFTIQAFDGTANSAPPVPVQIRLAPVVVAGPTANGQDVRTSIHRPVPIQLTGDGGSAPQWSFVIVSGPLHGILSGSAPDLLYVPADHFTGQDEFRFKVLAGGRESPPAIVGIQVAGTTLAGPGGGVSFDGVNDFLAIDSGINLANQSFTIEAWVRSQRSNTSQYFLFQGSGTANLGLHLGFRPSNVFTFGFWSNDLDTTQTYTDQNWHHWAATYNATSNARRIYRDGVLVASGTASADYRGTGRLLLGSVPALPSFFRGMIDELRIWTVARTAAEIQSTYRILINGDEPNLLGCWRFDEGAGTITRPAANPASSLNGVLQGGLTWAASQAPLVVPLSSIASAGLSGDGLAFRLGFSGLNDATYQVEASEDLLLWRIIGAANTAGSGQKEFMDALGIGERGRYYRIRIP